MPLPSGGAGEVDAGGGGGGRRRSGGGGDEEDGGGWRRWAVLVSTVWIQAVTRTNFDFSAYSSALKSSLGISQEALNYLATASDLGKALGWSSGLALLHLPLHAVLLVSAALGLAAYAVQYCCLVFFVNPTASSSSLAIPYPLVFFVCLVAGCSICWFNTVCFVLCIRSFSASNRPLAFSLSTSFNSLSAAFYTLFANAFSPASPSVYLLLNATLPLAASILALPAILLCHTQHDSHLQSVPRYDDRRVFLGLYILAFITGIYLVVFGSLNITSSAAWVILTGAMVLLALPLIIPACSTCSYVVSIDSASHHDDDLHKPLLLIGTSNNLETDESNPVMEKAMEQQLQGSSCGTIQADTPLLLISSNNLQNESNTVTEKAIQQQLGPDCAVIAPAVTAHHATCCLLILLLLRSSSLCTPRLPSQEGVTCSDRVACCRVGAHANGLFLMPKQQDGSTLAVGTALIGLVQGSSLLQQCQLPPSSLDRIALV